MSQSLWGIPCCPLQGKRGNSAWSVLEKWGSIQACGPWGGHYLHFCSFGTGWGPPQSWCRRGAGMCPASWSPQPPTVSHVVRLCSLWLPRLQKVPALSSKTLSPSFSLHAASFWEDSKIIPLRAGISPLGQERGRETPTPALWGFSQLNSLIVLKRKENTSLWIM